MTSYYPLPPIGAFTGYMPGASPYLAAGGYSTGEPAGYGMPLPPKFHDAPNSDWITPSERQFERRHLDSNIRLGLTDWSMIIGTALVDVGLIWLMSI